MSGSPPLPPDGGHGCPCQRWHAAADQIARYYENSLCFLKYSLRESGLYVNALRCVCGINYLARYPFRFCSSVYVADPRSGG